ncbi:MAG: TonB-dependent receptor, partial [Muribaculaceae bacterium]|nr:TonB-dependent receptor [Muribaculaceae bacterium]
MAMTAPIIPLLFLTTSGTAEVADSANLRNPLDEVVVTATRTPKTLKDVPVITRVIGSEELAHGDPTDIQELLTEELPGIEFGYAMSQETALQMGGFGGNAVLFLVDGERLSGETMDNVDYSRLDLTNASRVEIVKGAASALYGANAVGGVVNIISKHDSSPWSVDIDNRYRTLGDEYRTSGSVNFNAGKVYSSTGLQFVRSSRVQLTTPFDTKSVIHDIYGGNALNIKERLIYSPTDGLELTLRGGYFDRKSERITYDDRFHDYNGGLKCDWNPNADSHAELSYSYDQYDKKRYIGGQATNLHDYSDRQHIVRGLYSHAFGVNTLTAGADYMYDHLRSYQFAESEGHLQHSADMFVQFDWSPISKLNIVGSLRDDWYSASHHNAVTARLAVMTKLKPLTLRAGYSGGFRAPTLKEMFMEFDMAGIRMIYGNPDLKPERSHNLNLSLERNGLVTHGGWMAGSYSMTVSGQMNFYDSRITTEEIDSPEIGLPALR